jgi:hypothetical protein
MRVTCNEVPHGKKKSAASVRLVETWLDAQEHAQTFDEKGTLR